MNLTLLTVLVSFIFGMRTMDLLKNRGQRDILEHTVIAMHS